MTEFEKLKDIETYVRRGDYPAGLTKAEKANFRRKCRQNFKFEDGVLYYKKCSKAEKDEEWRICVRSSEEKARVLESCHACAGKVLFSKPIISFSKVKNAPAYIYF